MQKTIYNIELHETLELDVNKSGVGTSVLRVDGGWIYSNYTYMQETDTCCYFSSTLVPNFSDTNNK